MENKGLIARGGFLAKHRKLPLFGLDENKGIHLSAYTFIYVCVKCCGKMQKHLLECLYL